VPARARATIRDTLAAPASRAISRAIVPARARATIRDTLTRARFVVDVLVVDRHTVTSFASAVLKTGRR
jgi:hypothetical protein